MYLPANSESAFAFGVNTALDKIVADLPKNQGRNIVEVVNEARKSLLTNKVTKWIRVYQAQKGLYPAARFYDSKEEADTLGGPFIDDPEYRGAYPVEIEVVVPQKGNRFVARVGDFPLV